MKLLTFLLLPVIITSCTALNSQSKDLDVNLIPIEDVSIFTSSDKTVERSYIWARNTALSFSHDKSDAVGAWYEAALPNREAFCMRDVSHQTVGAHILGLNKHNMNMMNRFAENISEEKDWCTFWEINRYNLPAPADYSNDKEFWYNLNANYDVIYGCLKLYNWTGDKNYLENPILLDFYEKSLNEYTQRWQLDTENIMDRPEYMNTSPYFDINNPFHRCRGLASYVENFAGLTMSADLISTLYAGNKAFAEMCRIRGDIDKSLIYKNKAEKYKTLLNTKWWDDSMQNYRCFMTSDKTFHDGEGRMFVLWFDASGNKERIVSTVESILTENANVENRSHYPALLYRLKYPKQAYQTLTTLPSDSRSSYPEVSFGIIEGIVGGMMGIMPEAESNRITTLAQHKTDSDWTKIENLPIFNGFITVHHKSSLSTSFTNNTNNRIIWKAAFEGNHPQLMMDNKKYNASYEKDILDNEITYIEVVINPGETKDVIID